MAVVDLNADVGEWDVTVPVAEVSLMALISSANIACGVHAGNEMTMAATVELAAAHDVSIGAHPSLDDRANFGRREIQTSAAEVFGLVSAQMATLSRIAAARGVPLHHVKPHGALYNMASRDCALADAVAAAVATFDRRLVLFGLAGSELIAAGQRAGLRTASEVFADRGYRADGSLVPRSEAGAVVNDPEVVSDRALRMVRDQQVVAIDGRVVHVTAETICVHGDTAGAAPIARRIRDALTAAGIAVSAHR